MTFHRVHHRLQHGFEPNRGLEISIDFFDALLKHLRQKGYRILSLDDALTELQGGGGDERAPFVALTFDDGYRDLIEHVLPVLERHRAPITAYVTSGFADGSARMWWVELEESIRRLDRVDVATPGAASTLHAATPRKKAGRSRISTGSCATAPRRSYCGCRSRCARGPAWSRAG